VSDEFISVEAANEIYHYM